MPLPPGVLLPSRLIARRLPGAPPRGTPLPGAPGPRPPGDQLRQQRALPGGGGGAPAAPDLQAHNFHFPLEWAAVPGGPQMADGLRQAETQSAPYMAILNALRPPAAGQPYEAVPTIVRWLLGDCCDAFVNAARPFMAARQPPLPPGRQYLAAGKQHQYLGQGQIPVEGRSSFSSTPASSSFVTRLGLGWMN